VIDSGHAKPADPRPGSPCACVRARRMARRAPLVRCLRGRADDGAPARGDRCHYVHQVAGTIRTTRGLVTTGTTGTTRRIGTTGTTRRIGTTGATGMTPATGPAPVSASTESASTSGQRSEISGGKLHFGRGLVQSLRRVRRLRRRPSGSGTARVSGAKGKPATSKGKPPAPRGPCPRKPYAGIGHRMRALRTAAATFATSFSIDVSMARSTS